MNYIEYYERKQLLTDGKSNTKTAKNSLATYYLSLQPTTLNSRGVNLCKFATRECKKACLQFAGRQSFSNVVRSRENKTEFFVQHRTEFLHKLWAELESINKKGKAAIRLNLLSDVNWQAEFESIDRNMAELKKIQFYDYTKDPLKVEANQLTNYHLTYSYSGGNWQWCKRFLDNKAANVAVVFKGGLPAFYQGYEVVNGDLSDERFLDKKGVVVGLKYKTPKGLKYEKNKFVIEV